MNKLRGCFQLIVAGNFFFQEILNSFHVMIGSALDVFNALGIFHIKIISNAIKYIVGVLGKFWNFCDLSMRGKRLQPANLDNYPVMNEAILTENGTEGFSFAAITAINGGNRRKCC